MLVKPFPQKHKTEELANKLIISMPSLKFWPLLLVFCIWGLMWFGVEAAIISTVISDGLNILGGIFVIVWNILGFFLICNLLWQLIGKEEIQITSTSLKISYAIFGYRRSKEYISEKIKDLGLARVNMKDVMLPRAPFLWSTNATGLVSFDYGARTIRFASSIEEAEAKQILAEIRQKYPQYKKQIQEQ